jgi:hypothetical protein
MSDKENKFLKKSKTSLDFFCVSDIIKAIITECESERNYV